MGFHPTQIDGKFKSIIFLPYQVIQAINIFKLGLFQNFEILPQNALCWIGITKRLLNGKKGSQNQLSMLESFKLNFLITFSQKNLHIKNKPLLQSAPFLILLFIVVVCRFGKIVLYLLLLSSSFCKVASVVIYLFLRFLNFLNICNISKKFLKFLSLKFSKI